jgi:putative mRNA 3-end processing factor
LGKAQRIINNIDHHIGPIYTHGAIESMNDVYRKMGVKMPKTQKLDDKINNTSLQQSLIVAPPAAMSGPWAKKIKNASEAVASGWMAIRGNRRRRGADKGFALSDHVDWEELNTAVKLTGAQYIYPTHGYTAIYSKYLNDQGYIARPVATEYGQDEDAE